MINILENKEPLSQVIFIHDYIQLIFQEYILSIYNPIEIYVENKTITDGEMGFADALRNLIGNRVIKTNYKQNTSASFEFSNKVKICISLEQNDNLGPEAFQLNDSESQILVEQNA